MAVDVVVARELKSLQEELSTSQKERAAGSAATSAAPPSGVEPLKETPEERELRDQLRQLANEVTNYFDQAEKRIAAHPTESVVGALLLGILIGRLLGKR